MIEHPSSFSSKVTLLAGLAAAVLVALGTVWWSYAQEKRVVDKTRPDEFRVPSDKELRYQLSPEQFHVTRENGTETAFRNAYWDNHKPGIYVDIITNEPKWIAPKAGAESPLATIGKVRQAAINQ